MCENGIAAELQLDQGLKLQLETESWNWKGDRGTETGIED